MKRWLLAVPPAVWLLAQLAAPVPSPVARFPRGAVAVLEMRDFGALLKEWNASQAKKEWLAGDAYKSFLVSRLGARLDEALGQFASAAKVPLDSALVEQLAGSRTAIGVYNIGDLELLAVTRMPAASFALTALGQRRAAMQPRSVEGSQYFVSSDPATRRTFAFAIKDDWVVAGTSETLVAEFLQRTGGGVAAEEWFTRATAASNAEGEVRLVANLDALYKSPQFRTYWLPRNRTELAPYSASISDLDRAAGQWLERRSLIRRQPSTAPATTADWPALLRAVPANAGLYRAWANPDNALAARLIVTKLMQPAPAAGQVGELAPPVASFTEEGGESDWETRIDAQPYREVTEGPNEGRITRWLAGNRLKGLLHVQSTRDMPGNVWIGQEIGLLLQKDGVWDADSVRAELPDVAFLIDGGRLFLGNAPAILNTMRGANPALPPPPASASLTASFRVSAERQRYARWMARIEQPHLRPLQPGEQRPPDFLDGILPSLGRVVSRVAEQSVTATETANTMNQAVLYRLTP